MASVASAGAAKRIMARTRFKVLRAGSGTPARYSFMSLGGPDVDFFMQVSPPGRYLKLDSLTKLPRRVRVETLRVGSENVKAVFSRSRVSFLCILGNEVLADESDFLPYGLSPLHRAACHGAGGPALEAKRSHSSLASGD